MANCEHWLRTFAKLRQHGPKDDKAPHKPLLLLSILQLAEQDGPPGGELELTPELAFRFFTLWEIVAHRRSQKGDIRYPFHHLSGERCWTPLDAERRESTDDRRTAFARLDPDLSACLGDPLFRGQARRVLIESYFPVDEQIALYEAFELPVPEDLGEAPTKLVPEEPRRKGREARFRIIIVAAYHYSCALTGYRLTTVGGDSIVDAAHIHDFADSRNNDPDNGIALSKNAHWLFDHGLWTLDDDYRVMVAARHFTEASPDQRGLAEYHGQPIRLPRDERYLPNREYLAWHRRERFLAG